MTMNAHTVDHKKAKNSGGSDFYSQSHLTYTDHKLDEVDPHASRRFYKSAVLWFCYVLASYYGLTIYRLASTLLSSLSPTSFSSAGLQLGRIPTMKVLISTTIDF